MAKITLSCIHYDTCLPDYFGGHHLAWVCVPVDKRTTFKELRDSLHSELNMGAIGGNEPLTRDDSGDAGDKWFKAAHAAINRDIRPSVKGSRNPFRDLEPADESEDCVYAYFIFKAQE
jgi:hypothetical protein